MIGSARLAAACSLAFLVGSAAPGRAADWTSVVNTRLETELAELATARREIANEKIPMSKTLSSAEAELTEARRSNDDTRRQLDRRNLDLGGLRGDLAAREQEKSYIGSLLGEFARNFETRLHIAELARYHEAVERAKLAPENANLKPAEAFACQVELVEAALARIEGAIGGDRFPGRAAGPDGRVKIGVFALLGPTAYFASDDGAINGMAEQRLGSLEPSVQPYADPAFAVVTRRYATQGAGQFPFDPSLGNARKIEETRETFGEHLGKGGPVVIPIVGLAIMVSLVSLVKWAMLARVRMPAPRRLEALLAAVRGLDPAAAGRVAKTLSGPVGEMLRAGVAHLDAPKDLIEEVLFERTLETRFRLNKGLPLISVSAACAPLLGLLGTVTGIIGTFKLITVFGSGDVKMLSAGISEALITTELGLCVAIPSLVAHAFLSRKAKAIVDGMERLAISLLTAIEKARSAGEAPA